MLRWSGFELHFGKPPTGADPAAEDVGIAAFRALKSSLRRHGAGASPAEQAPALADLIEGATALGEHEEITSRTRELRGLALDEVGKRAVENVLGTGWFE